ncbi:hypothetical protein [Phaeacidiphilus oryzae]|uniref:hypothetical protein n=1 Tax=Phaeacidiphilus oryzae TaxID=348818 RepID=UPI00055A5B27|nr:hypothetical protein [Phaeacidiphilus oryzae]
MWFLILLIPSRTSVFAVAHVAGAIPAAVWLILLIQLGRDTPDRLAQNLGGALHWLGGTAAALVFAIGTAHGLRTRIDRLAAASPQALAVRARATIELPAVAFPAFLLFAGQILGGVWEAPLFLLMVWYSVALWRRLAASERAALSAAADVVLALLLGAVLVLLLVWLGNLLDLAPAEMTLVHGVAEHAAALADLPWWAWALCYALLAAGYLTALLLPGRALGRAALRALTGRRTRRVTPAVNALHRGLTVTRIALVLVVFVGLAAPPAVGGLLARQARAHYTVSLRKELQAEGESAFYRSVIARFAPRAPRPAVLAQMVLEIHETEPAPDHGRDGAAPAELLLAHRLGLLAARAADPTAYDQLPESITNRPPAPQEPASDAVLRQETAPYADPPPGVGQLDTRLAGDRAEQRRAAQQEHERDELRDLAAELTATAVTSALDSLPLGRSEALGVVREYLDGLAESPLRDRFLAWTARVERAVRASGIRRPPAADTLVDPDPTALRLAADAQLTDDLMAAHDLTGTDPEQKRADGEAPLAGAVHLAQQSQGVETGSHPCTGCVHLPQPGEGEHGGIGGEEGGFHGE